MDALDLYRRDKPVFQYRLYSLNAIREEGTPRPLEAFFSEKSIQVRFYERERENIALAYAVGRAFVGYNAADGKAVMDLATHFNLQARLHAIRVRDLCRFYAAFYNTINRRKKLKQ